MATITEAMRAKVFVQASGPKSLRGYVGYVTGKQAKPRSPGVNAPKKSSPKGDVDAGVQAINRRKHGVAPSAAKPKRGAGDKN